MGRVLLAALLLAVGCSSGSPVDTAFDELNGAMPSEWRQIEASDAENVRSARYDVYGEPADVAALVRSSLAAQGFMLAPGSGLPDPSVTQPPVTNNQTPGTVPLYIPTELPPVDAIGVGGLRGKRHVGTSRSVSFYPGLRPGWTEVDVSARAEG